MKNILILIFLFLVPSILGQTKQIPIYEKLERVIPNDSVMNIINNNNSIVFYSGEGGHNWCVVYQNANSYSFILGTNRAEEKKYPALRFDTIKLIKENSAVLQWAFDSLAIQANRLTPVSFKKSPFLTKGLFVLENGQIVFHQTYNIEDYSGIGQEQFNKNLEQLHHIFSILTIERYMNKYKMGRSSSTATRSTTIKERS